jgi:hypothetical protein
MDRRLNSRRRSSNAYVGVEKPDGAFGLLKGLNERVQQNAIEAAVRETDAIVVMLVEGVHGAPPGFSNPAG